MSLTNVEKTITLDVYDHDTTPSVIKTIQMDTGTRTVYAVIQNSRQDYDIGQNASVSLTVLRPDKTKVQITGETYPITETTVDGETITYYGARAELTQLLLAVKGNLKAQFKITSGEQELRSEIFTINNGEALDAGAGDWAGDLDGHNLDEMAQDIEDTKAAVSEMESDVSDLKSGFNDLLNSAVVMDSASGATANFVDGADDVLLKSLKVNIEPIQLGSGDPSPDNIRPIRGWDAVKVYHSGERTEDATEYDISLSDAGTVYGGMLDVVSGELTVDKTILDMGAVDWNYASGSKIFYRNQTDGINPLLGGDVSALCSCYPRKTYATRTDKCFWVSDTGFSNNNRVAVIDNDYEDATTFKSAMTGQTIVYTLATPITYTLTPTEIKSLLGVNNTWSDAGDVEVEYRADTKLYIDKRLAEVTA